jgi:plasmid stability protein
MSKSITIRNVPDEVRNELAARAARSGRSLQEFLRLELESMAAKPSVEDWLARVRENVAAHGTIIDPDVVVNMIREDRENAGL